MALRSALWGDGSVSGVTRDYGIAGLGLEIDSPLLGALATGVTDALPPVQDELDLLLGTDGLIADEITAALLVDLDPLVAAGVSGTVSLTGLDLAGSVATLLSTPLGDGVVSIDLVNGTIGVDLDELLGYDSTSINNLAPNTELVIDDTVINALVARVGTLLDDFTQDIIDAITAEIRDATLTVDLSVSVRILAGIDVLRADVDIVAPFGDVEDGTAAINVDAEALGVVGVINTALGLLGLPTVTDLIDDIELLLGPALVGPLSTLLADTVLTITTNLGAALALLTSPIVTALAALLAPLDEVLSVMVNVQPDQPGAPDPGASIPYDPATPMTSAQYLVSALRIGLLGVVPGDVANLSFGTASAGPLTAP